ncbi:hypothetical protein [Methanococcus voltae]|uniref:Uncharacterized protein n=1 Tax=Methanococcus voltae (strain ATCC BAA-1334 / A3) TaxID=456320 RepID=D7DSG1_METV3|nr:hypothetical protein [Methanococcus voltae]MCS3901597.1 hypothetical protein [Methanococcus voltae]
MNNKNNVNQHNQKDKYLGMYTKTNSVKNNVSKNVAYQILINLTIISYSIYSNNFKLFLNFFIINLFVYGLIYFDKIINFIKIMQINCLKILKNNKYGENTKIFNNAFYKPLVMFLSSKKVEFPNQSKVIKIKPMGSYKSPSTQN